MDATVETNGQTDITFILPTRNRREVVSRAIHSCLAVARPGVCVEVLVIDGNSTDGSWELLQSQFGRDARVRLLRQEGPKGFMPACFFSLGQVRTEFCTFMYDDDVLSPHWWELAAVLRHGGGGFAMGFGKVNDVSGVMDFLPPTRRYAIPAARMLGSFCHIGHDFPPHGLPYSPISCLTRTATLHQWAEEVRRWNQDLPFRRYWMLERNAGPDLMIYLLSCLLETEAIPVVDGVLGQWSAHPDSMTIQFESNDILLGYWLAKAWVCAALQQKGQDRTAGICAAGVYREGCRLLQERLRKGRTEWQREFAEEIEGVRQRAMAGSAAAAFRWAGCALRLPKPLRRAVLNRHPEALA